MACKFYFAPKLSDQRDKHGRRMISYPCKICGSRINRPTSDSSCSNLNKHAATCLRKQNESKGHKSLAGLGIKGTGDINPQEVNQLCAVWCAEAARPFSALVEESHKVLLHPTIKKSLPGRRTISRDIHMLYSAIQEEYKVILKAHTGSLYLGVDAWQSPNGFDILGTVVYRLAKDDSGEIKLEAMPLDFIWLAHSHTGEYLAQTVSLVVEKFGIQDKICGIVSDNASNNKVMVSELKKKKWARFKGETHWIRCFAHVLNLIAQAILRPFGSQKKSKTTNQSGSVPLDDSEDLGSGDEEEDAEEQIQLYSQGADESSLFHEDVDESDNESIAQNDQEETESLSLDDIENASDEDDSDAYTTEGCKQTLAKFRAIAKKLRYSPNSKDQFRQICRDKGCATPHTIERDVRTRWNSTHSQLISIIRCEDAILEWQRHKRHGVDRKYYLDQSDFNLARHLAEVMNIFYEITLQISIPGSARLSNIVIFIDQITEHLSTAISGTKYPPALRNACRVGLKLTNKYYSLTDMSPLYRIAIVLHPSFHDEYFKLANWEPKWISEAIRLTREMWVANYKPKPITPPTSSAVVANKPKTGMLAGLGSAAAARGGHSSTDPLDIWL
ncbi:uncharacterized protein PGTG_12161 [Puccinia graminis f. sp. tritici CRL 75-36-700-3]|uniref:DUF659 domain-containing protein n=1 Tax=Puccinia graminis f. sp. tritici (strain CRL 75-36-700-3 / race SCCL) TaxID=418459 RepID=E3KPH0_PUCGT|nr:uncharacterized protein PGTG_12161 [Puccinia graminis f. sp. tritici CRL 75-36-700-3]EFP86205.2 hypothetical protein PGTG_12161 [Puccinia graminis f. sp. tritici CRL 75-36-700-3]